MAESLEATGPRSIAAQQDHSVFKNGRFEVYHREPLMTVEERDKILAELSGETVSSHTRVPRIQLPELLIVDIHKTVMSGADVLEPESETLLSRFGRRFPKISKSLVTGYAIWQLRKSPR